MPFTLVNPQGQSVPNVVMLHGPEGSLPPTMPKRVSLPVGSTVRALHLLGGVEFVKAEGRSAPLVVAATLGMP